MCNRRDCLNGFFRTAPALCERLYSLECLATCEAAARWVQIDRMVPGDGLTDAGRPS